MDNLATIRIELGISAKQIISQFQTNNQQLEEVITQAITKNPQAVTDYKKGKANALQFLLGNVMAITKGKADPKIVKRLLNKRLKD